MRYVNEIQSRFTWSGSIYFPFCYRVKEQEVKVRDDEIKRLKSNYEEHIKMLQ